MTGTRNNIENFVPTIKHGGGAVVVWSFSGKGLGPLVIVEGKLNCWGYVDILEKHLLPYIQQNFVG